MLTYDLKKTPGLPLYEGLYRCIRADILAGNLLPGERLPSKRALAANLRLSVVTVEAAYSQLLAQGFIRAREKVGYFVENVPKQAATPLPAGQEPEPEPQWAVDLTSNATRQFPFSVWSRIQRQVLLDCGEALLAPLPNQGYRVLREAIAAHLAGFRALTVDPEQILIGAGTDFLYNLLIQLLGRDKLYAVEEPGYGKIWNIYAAGGVRCLAAPLDEKGVRPDALCGAQVLHCSPSHHFPTGIITPAARRRELLAWANEAPDRWIIEDDYDSEFRFDAHPVPAMQSLDGGQRVIYMNSFSKSLAPSIRISYLVLPPALMERFRRELGFYSCTVPSFEQMTLARFLAQGAFEKHINRMRRAYRNRRDQTMQALRTSPLAPLLRLSEQDAGLHFLVRVDTALTDAELKTVFAEAGVRVQCLSDYYRSAVPEADRHWLVVNYTGADPQALSRALAQMRPEYLQKNRQALLY